MNMDNLRSVLDQKKTKFADPDKNVSREFQVFGYQLAKKLDDLEHKALYIKLAKEEPRRRLKKALSFVLDYPNPRSRAKLFMFKLADLRGKSSDSKNPSDD